MSELKTIALVGCPNSGKTTLYNWLTNSNYRTVNYAGATVDYAVGNLYYNGSRDESYRILDTPGVYSLDQGGLDEEVTQKILFEGSAEVRPDLVVMVVDGTQLLRQLPTLEMIYRSGHQLGLIITMKDLLEKNKISVDVEKLKEKYHCEVFFFDGIRSHGLEDILQLFRKFQKKDLTIVKPARLSDSEVMGLQRELKKVLRSQTDAPITYKVWTQKIDKVLLHPVLGFFAFFVIMTSLFASVFWLATPFMDWIDGGFGFLIERTLAVAPDSLLADFFANGLLTAFASVLVFVPQIFILFLGVGVLESTGYLSRAATVIDRPLSLVGLSGRSFVPLLSGFACAIPAMMATRNISSTKERWIANFIIPLMSCSARLPVYSLLVVFLLPEASAVELGFAFALIYFTAALIGALAAGILSRLLKNKKNGHFLMELPLYRLPRFKFLAVNSFHRTQSYVTKAGPIIFVIAVGIWMASSFPRTEWTAAATPSMAESYLGMAGQKLEPIFEPMGLDWRVGVGLISAFAAREVFVSTLALVFNTTTDEEGLQSGLLTIMKDATNSQGELIFTVPSVVGLIVFFIIALQCMSTFAVSVRESGSWKFAWIQLLVLNAVAYALAVGINLIF
ncbi:MAG: ferrous iron transporter B [Bdellovibrionia bacterium]